MARTLAPGVPVTVAWLTLSGVWVFAIVRGDAGPDPAKWLLHQSGIAAALVLVATLAVSPLRRLAGRAAILRWRRPLGLAAFAFAVLHVTVYTALYQGFDAGAILDDIAKRPFIIAGAAAWLLLLPLAVTSTRRMQQRLGPLRWRRLHRLVYPAAVLAIAHYALGQKTGWGPAGPLALLLALLFAERIVARAREKRALRGTEKNR